MNLDFVAILKKIISIPYVIRALCFGKVLLGIAQTREIFSLDLLSWQYYQLKLKRRKMRTTIARAYNNQHHDQSAVRVLKSQLTYIKVCFESLKSRIIEKVLYLFKKLASRLTIQIKPFIFSANKFPLFLLAT